MRCDAIQDHDEETICLILVIVLEEHDTDCIENKNHVRSYWCNIEGDCM